MVYRWYKPSKIGWFTNCFAHIIRPTPGRKWRHSCRVVVVQELWSRRWSGSEVPRVYCSMGLPRFVKPWPRSDPFFLCKKVKPKNRAVHFSTSFNIISLKYFRFLSTFFSEEVARTFRWAASTASKSPPCRTSAARRTALSRWRLFQRLQRLGS